MASKDDSSRSEDAALSRRRALKLGVAAGVGAAAWGGPQISRLGVTPAYAINCTPSKFQTLTINGRNTNAGSCKDANNVQYLRYQQESFVAQGLTYVVAEGATIPQDAACSLNAFIVQSAGGDPDYECVVQSIVINGSTVSSPGGNQLPVLPKATYPANSTYSLTVKCGPKPSACT